MPRAQDVWILSGARTPIGAFLGGLSRHTATQLGAVAAAEALRRSNTDPATVDGVFWGNVLQTSRDAVYIARHVALDAGVPESTPALTVNRACGSGLDAITCGAKALMVGEASVVLAGGSENMSQTPYAVYEARRGSKLGHAPFDDMLLSALNDPKAGCSIGQTVEHLAATHGITRQQADEAAVEGQRRAAQAHDAFAQEIVAVPGRRGPITRDEAPRPDTSMDGLARLRGLFARDGVITAGNSCGLNDAGAAVVLSREPGPAPLGRLLSWAAVGVPPIDMALGPVAASRLALEHAGLTLDQVDVIELNDSFTVQSIAVQRALGLDPAKVNPNGGAIALGHPMGATGTRVVLAALMELQRRGGGVGLCTVCVGGGQGVAAVVSTS